MSDEETEEPGLSLEDFYTEIIPKFWLGTTDLVHDVIGLLDTFLADQAALFEKYQARVQQDAVPDGAEIIPFPNRPEGEGDG